MHVCACISIESDAWYLYLTLEQQSMKKLDYQDGLEEDLLSRKLANHMSKLLFSCLNRRAENIGGP